MDDHSDSTGRRPEECLLFAIAFVGFVVATGGVILSSLSLAFSGAMLLLLALLCFLRRSPAGH